MTRYYRRRRPVSGGWAFLLACAIIAAVISPWALVVLAGLVLFLAAVGYGRQK